MAMDAPRPITITSEERLNHSLARVSVFPMGTAIARAGGIG
jgi:hypothetical protein